MAGAASTYDIVWHYGDNLNGLSVVWKDPAGVPVPLTGYLASMKIKDADGNLYLHLDSDTEGGLTLTPAEGKVTFDATPAKMTGGSIVPGDAYLYDLQVKKISDGSVVKTLIKGSFTANAEQTDV